MAKRSRAKVNWDKAAATMLGRMPDREVARRLGVPHLTVARKRGEMNIPAWRKSKQNAKWTPETIALLGTVSDGELAAIVGATVNHVAFQRKKAGIPAFGKSAKWKEADARLKQWMSELQDPRAARLPNQNASRRS